MSRYLIFILAYCLGAIPFAYLAGAYKGIDVRRHGSGNIGTTNAFRLLGAKLGIMVLLGDFLKGALSAYLGLWAFGFEPWGELLAGCWQWQGIAGIRFSAFDPVEKGLLPDSGLLLY